MSEVLGRCEPDLRVLPVVEPKRPDAVERWLPPEVPKTPSPVAPCEPKSPGVEMPADSALRSDPTPVGEAPVSPVAEPPIAWLVCDRSFIGPALIELPAKVHSAACLAW
jgi:hypothetical protein